MFAKITIALVIIVTLDFSTVIAQVQQRETRTDEPGIGPVLINRCLPENWDGYGTPCDKGGDH